MARNINGEVAEIWADNGDTAAPPVTFDEGWPLNYSQTGGAKPSRTGFNFLFKELYSMGKDISQFGGSLPYSATIDFEVDAIITSAGVLYIALQANGPASAVKDPATNPLFWGNPISGAFSETTLSAEQVITQSGGLVIAHNLSSTPTLVVASVICKVAQHNYSVGDIVPLNGQMFGTTGTGQGVSIVSDATNMTVRYGNDSQPITILDKTTGSAFKIVTNWRLIIRAWV